MTALATANKRLPQLCEGMLTYGIGLRRSTDPGTMESIKQHVARMLAEIDQQAGEAGLAAADVQMAKYALVAYLDEIVLSSHWDIRTEWGSRPLQLEYFNDFTAGEEFYKKLETVRRQAGGQDLVEVYTLCLGLGFRGKNADLAGMERLKTLMSDLNRELQAGRQADGPGLSQNWKVEERFDQRVKRIPVWAMASIGLGALLFFFVILNTLLGWSIADLKDLAGGDS